MGGWRGEGAAISGNGAGEARLVARVRNGETEAYAELVRAHAQTAHRLALLLGAGAEAEDVVQNAFIKAYRALGGFRDGAAFRPWLLRIVANETKNTVRAAARRRAADERAGAWAGGTADGGFGGTGVGGAGGGAGEDPVGLALAAERREELLTALRALRERHREVVIHRYLLDLDEAETAAALGVPRGTVKSRLSRALRELARLLGEGDRGRERERERERDRERGREPGREREGGGLGGA
ncbi:sigma-70 family RNA polymerase sigma factor [Streptomyces sp. WMMC500]|uniref:RNA polymerase sigma factor n=1 Tax=Streptomyces sp. WMMC500 TaxID=3015154 RepID=UPI00248C10D4|nr:sigma-70 family RNA polymerase sigma factor [Streptomyces sp. WMMC500]WBB63623.1 sigma-70 family RNA polymerase sigma factor [Streptomyces sp. WMMC500]